MTTALILFAIVVLSGIAGLQLNRAGKNSIKLLLAFSGAYLLGLSILHLFPEVYASGDNSAGYYILLGFLLQVALEYFSGGLEHGHAHVQTAGRLPWAMLISLCIHSFIEAMPLAAASGEQELLHDHHGHHHHDYARLSFALLAGIAFHKIPVTLVLVVMLLKSGMSKKTTVAVLLVFAAMAPLGAGSVLLTGGPLGPEYFSKLLGIVLGIFLHISTTILFEASDHHRFHLYKIFVIVLGLALAAAGDLNFSF